MKHDLYVVGLQDHAKRIADWCDREITPRWLDWILVGGALVVIVYAAVAR